MSRKRYTKKEEEDYDWISDNWEGEHPYNWYGKYGEAGPTMHEIVEKYSEDEARTILIMVKILHDTNSEINNLIKNADFAQGMMGQSIVYRLTLYRLLDQFYTIPSRGDFEDENEYFEDKNDYLKYIAENVFYRESRDHPILLFYFSLAGGGPGELYKIISSDDKDHEGNRWFRGIDPNKKGEVKIYIRSVRNPRRVMSIDPLNLRDQLRNWFLIPKNLDFDHKDLYPEDFMTVVPEEWTKYEWTPLRQVAQRKLLTTESFSGLTRMTPWGDKPYQNQLLLKLDNGNVTREATLSNVFKDEYTEKTGKRKTNPTYRYHNSCTLCGHILPDKPDVDHVFNLFLNSLLEIDSRPEGYSDTCAACNRFLKSDKVFNLRRDTWLRFLAKAGWKEDKMDWGRPPVSDDSFNIGESYGYRYDVAVDYPKPEILSRTGHVRGYNINDDKDIPLISENVLEDFYIRRILFLIKNNDVVKGILRPLMGKLASVKSEDIQDCTRRIKEKFNDDIMVIKTAASALLAGDKIWKSARGSDYSPNTKKDLAGMTKRGRRRVENTIRVRNINAVRKGQYLQHNKHLEVLGNEGASSAYVYDPLTTERIGMQYAVPAHGNSQNIGDAIGRALGRSKRKKSIREKIRRHGFGDVKRGLKVAEGEEVFLDSITAETLRRRKVWCQDQLPKLLAELESDSKILKKLETRLDEEKKQKKKTRFLEREIESVRERKDINKKLYNECVELWGELTEEEKRKGSMKLGDRIMQKKWEIAREARKAPKEVTYEKWVSSGDESSSSESGDYSDDFEDDDGDGSTTDKKVKAKTVKKKDGPGSSSTSNPRVSPVIFSRKNPRTSPVTTPSSSTGLATIGNKRTVSPKKVEQGNVKKTTAEMGKQTFAEGYDDYWGGGRKKRTRRRRKKKKKRTRRRRKKKKKRTKKKRRRRKKRTRRRR